MPQQVLVRENLSDRRVQARFDGDLVVTNDNKPTAAGVFLLEPGEKRPDIYLQRDFTIKELSANYTAKQAGQQVHQVRGNMTVEDDRDNGSTDRWDLVLTGCPVQPVPDHEGLRRIAPWHLPDGSRLRTWSTACCRRVSASTGRSRAPTPRLRTVRSVTAGTVKAHPCPPVTRTDRYLPFSCTPNSPPSGHLP